MAKAGETKCYYKPNRTVTRRYTAKDVARIYCHATRQGVSRAEIARQIEEKCPAGSQECTCDELLAELLQSQRVAEMLLQMLAIVVPIAKIIGKIAAVLKAARMERLRKEAEMAQKQLEDMGSTKPIIEAEWKRIIEKQAEVAAKIEGGVVIRP